MLGKLALRVSHLSLVPGVFSLPSLPFSDVAFESIAPFSSPLRMIFMAGIIGGGVLPVVEGVDILVNDRGILQNGVL